MTNETVRKKSIRISAAAVLWGIYLISLLPMLLIARYNYPSADDFTMGLAVHRAYLEGGFAAAVAEDFAHTWYLFLNWTGYFTSNLLMCIPPNVFGESFYRWTTVLLLAGLTIGAAVFFHTFLHRICSVSREITAAVTAVMLLIGVQCMPVGLARAESFYWYNGAVNYILTFALGLVYLSLLFSFLCLNDEGKNRRVLHYVLLALISFFIGGSNYMSALTCAFLSASVLLLICTPLRKLAFHLAGWDFLEGVRNRRARFAAAVPCILMLAGFACSCLAPGNKVRGSAVEGFGAVRSILISLYYALAYCVNQWTRWEVIILLLILLPFLWKGALSAKLTFRCPFLVSVLLYGITAMNFCPTLYALGNIEAGRVQSLLWLQYLICLILGVFYWLGWLQRHVRAFRFSYDDSRHDSLSVKASVKYLCVLTLFLMIGSALCVKAEPNYYTSTAAAADLLNGHAAVYAQENAVRESVLHDPEIRDAELLNFTYRPELLFFSDISEDSADWINDGVARYYDKNSVVLVPGEN